MINTAPSLTQQGAVATITLRRPQQANRLSAEDLQHLGELIEQVNHQPAVLVLQLRATGKHFCSGYDIRSLGGDQPVHFDKLVDAVEAARPVTVAVLQGGVYGGATDLALACDFRIGTPGVDMFMPAARLGLHFYRSGLERYVTRLGLDHAKRLFLTGQRIDAVEMKRIGFLTHLVDAEQLEAVTQELTQACAGMAPLALLGMKRHLNAIARNRLNPDELEADIQRTYRSADLLEGQAAWAEKRSPRFTGH